MKRNGSPSKKPIIITIIAVVLLLVLSLISSGKRTVTWIESAVNTITAPIQTLAQSVSNAIVKGLRELFNTTDADKENAQLKAQIAVLQVEVENLEEMRQEIERLRGLLNYADTLQDTKYVTATIIANSNSIWFNSFTLNAGTKNGVRAGDPVVTGDGLVGLVENVSSTTCTVCSLIDVDSKEIGVMVERTRDNCFIRGTIKAGSGNDELELFMLPSGSDLTPGDIIITNGLGSSRIPKGIPIGTVAEVMRISGTGTNETNAIINPGVDFLHLEDVMILTTAGDSE